MSKGCRSQLSETTFLFFSCRFRGWIGLPPSLRSSPSSARKKILEGRLLFLLFLVLSLLHRRQVVEKLHSTHQRNSPAKRLCFLPGCLSATLPERNAAEFFGLQCLDRRWHYRSVVRPAKIIPNGLDLASGHSLTNAPGLLGVHLIWNPSASGFRLFEKDPFLWNQHHELEQFGAAKCFKDQQHHAVQPLCPISPSRSCMARPRAW